MFIEYLLIRSHTQSTQSGRKRKEKKKQHPKYLIVCWCILTQTNKIDTF